MRRDLRFMILGIVGLLLAAVPGSAPEPAWEPGTPVLQPFNVHPSAATREAPNVMASWEASLATALPRPNQPSIIGIVIPAKIPVILKTLGLITTIIVRGSAREFGFDRYRRGPPSPPSA